MVAASLPSPPCPKYLILVIFFVCLCKLSCKVGKNKKQPNILGTTLCLALHKGKGVSLGSKIISASQGLTWAGKEDAVHPQAG